MYKLMSVILVVVVAMCSGCASIVSKSQYPVTINSNPGGASVTVKNKQGMEIHKATTPATLPLNASSGFFSPERYTFEFEKEGYFSNSASLSAGVDGWYIGNILFGGLIGLLIVDPATGAMYKLENTIYGNLSPDPNFEASSHDDPRKRSASTEERLPSQAVAAQLKELRDLLDTGLLTEEEYEIKRKALVNKL